MSRLYELCERMRKRTNHEQHCSCALAFCIVTEHMDPCEQRYQSLEDPLLSPKALPWTQLSSLSHSSNLYLFFSLSTVEKWNRRSFFVLVLINRRKKSESQYTSATHNMTKTCVTRRFDKDKATLPSKAKNVKLKVSNK